MTDDLFKSDLTEEDFFKMLEHVPPAELSKQWPRFLAEMVDVAESVLKAQGDEAAYLTACKVVAAIAHYCGGRAFYLPMGTSLKEALRNYQIYAEFNGRNIDALRQKYRLSQSTIYSIIREQHSLTRKRLQRELDF